MSKAIEKAYEAYPKDIEEYIDIRGVKSVVDNNSWQRTIFLKGYHQAEKDLELTWKDIRDICRMWMESKTPFGVTGEALSTEVLKRFKAHKGGE